MLPILFRILLLVALVLIIYNIYREFSTPSGFVRCGRCEGKGYWEGVRNKKECDHCAGSGKISKNEL